MSKRVLEQPKQTQRQLSFDPPHVFRVKSAQSLAHLQESREFLPCPACSQQQEARPYSSKSKSNHETFERLSRPKSVPPVQMSENINWKNFIQKKSKYAIKSPYAYCNPLDGQEHADTRPPFVNYGGKYNDKSRGEKRTFNSRAIHQMKHREAEEQRLLDVMKERRLRLQAEAYFREMEERKARAQELQDRAARVSTEYRDNYRPPADYQSSGTFARH